LRSDGRDPGPQLVGRLPRHAGVTLRTGPVGDARLADRAALMVNYDVLIIGAGIAGLSCGVRLAEAGLKVCVVEASDVPGGRARRWSDTVMGESVDIGPHILLNKYANRRALLERLGTADQVLWQTEELLTVFDRGRSM